MTYVLPDEPRGAVRPDLAVGTIWPFLGLMLTGPLPGFAWMCFNSWALGCRNARLHTALGIALTLLVGFGVYAMIGRSEALFGGWAGEYATLVAKLIEIALRGIALIGACWIVWEQDDAENWRSLQGENLRNGLPFAAILFGADLFLGGMTREYGPLFTMVNWVALR